jgi:quinol monooxygenase YgiN
MGQVLRMVTFRPLEGRQDALRDLLASKIINANREFGALQVWCLSDNAGMAIISLWAALGDLDAMRADPGYKVVLDELKSLSTDLVDRRYDVIAGASR